MSIMQKQSCVDCQELNQIYDIRSPYELRHLIHVLDDYIKKTIVTECDDLSEDSADVFGMQTPFSDIVDGKPWGDYLDYYFQCTKCSQIYRLCVETYHGCGGKWSPVDV